MEEAFRRISIWHRRKAEEPWARDLREETLWVHHVSLILFIVFDSWETKSMNFSMQQLRWAAVLRCVPGGTRVWKCAHWGLLFEAKFQYWRFINLKLLGFAQNGSNSEWSTNWTTNQLIMMIAHCSCMPTDAAGSRAGRVIWRWAKIS